MKTLLQLVSEQTMQNLLPAMALRPERIIHLCTPRMQEVSEALSRAYKAAGLSPHVEEVRMGNMPGLRETAGAFHGVFRQFGDAIVNFTGGTKLMSIGAYAAASVAKKPSFYVDTASGCFVDGGTAPGLAEMFPGQNLGLDSIVRQLSVSTIAIANGVERVTGGSDWRRFVPLARLLVLRPDLEQECFNAASKWLATMPRDFSQRRTWMRNMYSTAFRGVPADVVSIAVSSGLFEERNGSAFPAGTFARRLFSLQNTAKQRELVPALEEAALPLEFLQGKWWEVAVADHFDRSGKCRDIRWSVHAGSRGTDSTDLEEDVLGVSGANLLYVSCKRGGLRERLSRFLEETESSARRIGGSFARKVFAVFLPQRPMMQSKLQNRCKELRIEFLDGETVRKELPTP